MSRSILLAGLPSRLSAFLAQRIPGAAVELAFGADEVLAAIDERAWSLLLVDAALDDRPVEDLVARVRARRSGSALPVAVVLDPLERPADLGRVDPLVQRLGVERVFFHPVDPGEVARFAAEIAGETVQASEAPPAPAAGAPALAAGLARVWMRSRDISLGRARLLSHAAAEGAAGRMTRDLRQQAGQEAHRLAGLLGTFGLPEGSELAREAEEMLLREGTPADAARLGAIAASLLASIERHQPPADLPVPMAPSQPTLQIFARGPALHAEAAAAATRCGLAPVEGSRGGPAPTAALLELLADDEQGWRTVAELAAAWPGVPLVVAASRDSLLDRVRAVQLGVSAVVTLPASAEELADALRRVIPPPTAGGPSILSLDDDESLQQAVKALLAPQGMTVHTETDPARFWERLADTRPDLVILDVEMPRLNGVEMCRVLRADPRYRDLPILFLTARTDAETIYRVFAAGADDYVPKPVVGPELTARIRNRLGRARAG